MNFLESLLPKRPLSKAPEPKKDARIFGKDLTNIISEKPKVNQSFQQKPAQKAQKQQCRPRSKSITTPDVAQQPKDAAFQYQTEIINEILRENRCLRPIKCSAISLRMRAILVDWLVDVHSQFQLKEETLFLAIRILDDYCAAAEEISKKTLQLIGITCLWIASKYEEIYPPKIKNYVVVTDNTYTQNQIHETEAKILQALKFQVLKTTPLHYLSAILGSQYENTAGSFCRYLFQLCNIQFLTTEYRPTVLVLTALEMCERLLKLKTEAKKYKQWFKVEQQEINQCFKKVCKLLNGTSWEELNAIKRKYSKSKFHSVGRVKLQKA